MPTFNAKTVLPPSSLHLVTAPPAPSPRLPSSMIFPSLFAAFHPRSSKSCTSSGCPLSSSSFARSTSSPCILPSLAIASPPDCAELTEGAAEPGSLRPLIRSWKLTCEIELLVDSDPAAFVPVLAPKLFVRLCAESSLLFAALDAPKAPGITKGGPRFRGCTFSCGVWFEPIGVAKLNFGACDLPIAMGCMSAIGGAAELLTGLWCGEAGIDSPSRGTFGPDCCRGAPGIGGRSSGAGDAISERSGGSTLNLVASATVGGIAGTRLSEKAGDSPPSSTACEVCVLLHQVLVGTSTSSEGRKSQTLSLAQSSRLEARREGWKMQVAVRCR